MHMYNIRVRYKIFRGTTISTMYALEMHCARNYLPHSEVKVMSLDNHFITTQLTSKLQVDHVIRKK